MNVVALVNRFQTSSVQECIPLGCVPPILYRMGGVSLPETPLDRDPLRTETSLDRDPSDIIQTPPPPPPPREQNHRQE